MSQLSNDVKGTKIVVFVVGGFFMLWLGSYVARRYAVAASPAIVKSAIDGDIETAKKLIADGVDVNETGVASRTALHWAVFDGQVEIVRLLLDSGADVDAQDLEGATALHLAIHSDRPEMAKMLLAGGAESNHMDKLGKAPRDYVDSDDSRLAQILDGKPEAAGGPTTESKEPETTEPAPMHFALRCLGWVVLGFFGAGAIGAWMRGKDTQLIALGILGFAGYRTYVAWQSEVSVIPPILCIAVALFLGPMAKQAGDAGLEDGPDGVSRYKRRGRK